MDFGLSLEIGADIYEKAETLNGLSKEMQRFFQDKDFGDGIKSLTIGLICVPPDMEFFFKVRSKYYKTTRVLEYDIRLPYEVVRQADEAGVLAATGDSILKSVAIIEKQQVAGFDVAAFVEALHEFFIKNGILPQIDVNPPDH